MMIRINGEIPRKIPRVLNQLHVTRGKRITAYPKYDLQHPLRKSHPTKDHSSINRLAVKLWLGPKNVRGEYYRNRYFYPPQNHTPNYIVPNGQTIVDSTYDPEKRPKSTLVAANRTSLNPFPLNTATKTSSVIPKDLVAKIVYDTEQAGLSSHDVAMKYGIRRSRIEAVLTLNKIRLDMKAKNQITPEMERFGQVMYKMFPLLEMSKDADNLTEIPTPHKTLHQRFMTIAELEPFGPVDAARVLDLPVASDTLASLAIAAQNLDAGSTRQNCVVVGLQRQNDRYQFKFTSAVAGKVGFRYGASRRDRQKDRGVAFDQSGRMIYV